MTSQDQDKALLNHYRPADCCGKSCNSCARKAATPYMWCPFIVRQVDRDHVCDLVKVEGK